MHVHDVLDNRQAEPEAARRPVDGPRALLEQAEHALNQFFAHAHASVTHAQLYDRVVGAARDPNRAVSWCGWREDEAHGRPITEIFRIVNEHTRAVVANPVEKVLEVGGVVGLANHTVLISRDGHDIPIDDSGAPIRGQDGSTIEGVVLVFRDVSERKQAEMRSALVSETAIALAQSLDYEATIARVAQLAVPRVADWCAVDIVTDEGSKRLAVSHVDPAKVELAHELARTYPIDPAATTGVPQVLRTGVPELHREISDDVLVARCVDAEHLRLARALKLRSSLIVPLIKHHIMLSDIGMPGMDGIELIRKVRLLPREQGGDIPAAALTAYARTDDRRRILNAGYSIHVAKPIEPAELVAVVSTLSRFLHRDSVP